jgi:threonine dehydrogenase-like Zn-dependent dehydrogenase
MPEDPNSAHDLARKGRIAFDFGQFWTKGLRMATGQTNVKNYNRQLCRLIEVGKAKPSLIVSHQLSLDEAPDAYRHFDARENGWTKVVLRPHAHKAGHTNKRSQPGQDRKRGHQQGGPVHH